MTPAARYSFANHKFPQVLKSNSKCPNLFDGTTRLYYDPLSFYGQRVRIARSYKGLEEEIECVAISISDKPVWFTEKLYPVGKVPVLEHNGQVKGESLDLLEYLDQEFGGPTIMPTEEDKKEAAAELLKYTDTFHTAWRRGLGSYDVSPAAIENAVVLDYLENALRKYATQGPFFLGHYSLVDVAYAPYIERFQIAFSGVSGVKYDITAGRPNLAKWIQAINTVDAHTSNSLEHDGLRGEFQKVLDRGFFRRFSD
ncbi:unnamed protein product [Sphagnum jensenii]|uniref:GST N-terminal domain-containing protein n=1 Tax=Sphagnum jensenii TaxID=128206 RepID=A0ABP0W0E1_9BRYO